MNIRRVKKRHYAIIIGLLVVVYVTTNYQTLGFGGYIDYYFLYSMKIFLWLLIGVLIWVFPRCRFAGLIRLKNMVISISLVMAMLYVIIFVNLGVFTQFGKNPFSLTWGGVTENLLLMCSILIGGEYSRAFLINNLSKKYPFGAVLIISIVFAMIQIPLSMLTGIDSGLELMDTITQTVFPQIMLSIMASYFAYVAGPVPAIIYLGIIRAFSFLSPYIPDPAWMPKLLFNVLVPALSFYIFRKIYSRQAAMTEEKKKEGDFGWVVVSAISVVIMWFAVGLFPIFPSVIMTGSMEPVIEPGDMALVRKVDFDSIQVGDIIMYKNGEGLFIIHRVTKIIDADEGINISEKQLITKGDNNPCEDINPIVMSQLKGRVITIIPKLGILTFYIRGNEDNSLTS